MAAPQLLGRLSGSRSELRPLRSRRPTQAEALSRHCLSGVGSFLLPRFTAPLLFRICTSPSENDLCCLYSKLPNYLNSSALFLPSALRQKPTGELVHILSSYFVSSLPLMTQSFSPRSIRLSSRGSWRERMVNPILFSLF